MSSGDDRNFFDRIPAFSVMLIMAVLMVVGAAMIPLLSIQYSPTVRQKSISVSFSWSGASAKVIEQEVTSRLEGIAASIKGINEISSVSRQGYGNIDLTLKPRADINAVRFELAGAIRSAFSKLPEGVAYPLLSVSSRGSIEAPLMTLTLNADMPSQQILRYAENNIMAPLAAIEGVGSIDLSGATPFYTEVRYDPDKMDIFGVSVSELQTALINAAGGSQGVGIMPVEEKGSEGEGLFVFMAGQAGDGLEPIPVKKAGERIIRLGDIASVSVREELPLYYNRINGLNNINIQIYPERGVNTLRLGESIRKEIERIREGLPEDFSILTADDTTVHIRGELNKIYLRTVLSLFILLGFVLLVSRSWRYLWTIVITFVANILVAFIFYRLLNVELHLYSLAGVTVSFGMIIDTSIIMIDHWGRYRNRKAFLSILAALLTTIASLVIIFFLPEAQRATLGDFAMVMIVNLSISMVISLIFLPVLMDNIRIRERLTGSSSRIRRLAVRHRRAYAGIIRFGRRRRRWFVLLMILAFGLPVFLLPTKISEKRERPLNRFEELYNKTLGSEFYNNKLRKPIDIALGGTLRMFSNNIRWGNYYREPARPELSIRAGMPEGCTVNQLNDIIVMMENYLSRFDQIETFRTTVRAYNDASITVTFKEEFERGAIPLMIKSEVISKVIDYGGAAWSVYGIDEQGFSNNIGSSYKSQRIRLEGYNYDDLYDYAVSLRDELAGNRRVTDPGVFGTVAFGNTLSRNEFVIDIDREAMARKNIEYRGLFETVSHRLSNSRLLSYFDGQQMMNLSLTSADIDNFDLWHIGNQYINAGDAPVKFADFGTVTKQRSGNDIYRHNQQYRLVVAYDFVGSTQMQRELVEQEAERMNNLMAMGFVASNDTLYYSVGGASQYWLLFLIIAIIYFICAILFESLSQPFVIISIIPVSFIGLFLTFSLFGFRFDQGGFAAMVLLCGLVVNAGIYLINQYNNISRRPGSGFRRYLKAYDTKIVPILLTVVSTVLGLIPFLTEGGSLVFWFAFAVGSIGGLIFSLIALYFFLPMFLPMRESSGPTMKAGNL